MLRTVRSDFSFHSWRNTFSWPASWGRTFVVTLVFVTLASGLFWLDFFRSYEAEVTVLVISKTGVSGISQDVAGNMVALTRTLYFYERVLADNDFIDDDFAGSTPDKRKASWNDRVSVERQKGSSALIVRAVGDTPEQAARLARQTAQTMFSVAGLYYNVKTDIDMRIVDGPIVAWTMNNAFLFFLTSICTGFFVTAIFFLLLNMVPGFIGGRRTMMDELSDTYVAPERTYQEFAVGETVPWIDPQKFVPTKPKTLSFENIVHERSVPVSPMVHAAKRAQAPSNLPASTESYPASSSLGGRGEPMAHDEMDLPVADEASLPFEFEARPEEIEMSFIEPMLEKTDETVSEPDASAHVQDEPTAEEYKRRLNELLAGGR